MENTVTVHVRLPEEGNCARPTQAVPLGNNLFKLLPIENYKKSEEVWEFPPESIVKCEKRNYTGKDFLLAVEEVKSLEIGKLAN